MVSGYVPDRGDVVWLMFNKTRGHEQHGRRPALVLSEYRYNHLTGLAVVCPVTSTVRGYTFAVDIQGGKIHGSVLSDQVQSAAWKERRARFIETVSGGTLAEVTKKLGILIGIQPPTF